MTTPDFRALILELAEELDHQRQCLMDDRGLTHPLADRARAALAEGEAGPSDDQLNTLWNCCGIADDYGHHEGNIFEYARAVLARYGTTPPRPVPVDERLPGPEDCNDEGEVWVIEAGYNYAIADTGDYDWEPHRIVMRSIGQFDAKNNRSWLPAHAIPTPENADD